MVEDNVIDVDTMLWHVGDFGKYQCILMVLFSVINILSAFHYFGQTFIGVVPDYKCKLLLDEDPRYLEAGTCSYKIYQNESVQEIPCSNGWNYRNSYGYVSIVEEVCTQPHFLNLQIV